MKSIRSILLAGAICSLIQGPALAYELVFDVDSRYNNLARVASASKVVELAVTNPYHPEALLKSSGRFQYTFTPMVPVQDQDNGVTMTRHGQIFKITPLDAEGRPIGLGSTSVSVVPRQVFNGATVKSLLTPASGLVASALAGYYSGSQLSPNATAGANMVNATALVASVLSLVAHGMTTWEIITASYQYDERYVFEARPSQDQASGIRFTRRLSSN